MPLDAADPRPRNPFGQFSPGAALSPDQMNRAYGIRTKVLASILSTRPAMKNIPALPAKDIARISGLAAKARSLVNLEKLDLGEKPLPSTTVQSCPCEVKQPSIWYPSIYIGSRTNAGDKLAQIPRKGKAVIEYRVRDITTTEDADGKVTSSASLEVQSIDPVGDDSAAPVAGAEFATRLERLIGFGCGGKRPAKELLARVLRTPVELAGGYVNTDEGVRKERGAGAHFNRATGRWIGTVMAGPVGLPVGYLIDRSRRKHNIAKTKAEAVVGPEFAKGRVFASPQAKPTALSAVFTPAAGDKIPRPRFVEDDGFVKIIRSDGTASEIGRAPGFANRLRRNKGKLIVGGLGAVAGALAAKKLLGGKKAA